MKTKRTSRLCCKPDWMVLADLPDVLSIENACFPHPWTEKDFTGTLARKNCVGRVARWNGRVIGYAIFELLRHRIELLNLAVHAAVHRRGVGSLLLRDLIDRLRPDQDRRKLTVLVSERNLDAQKFLREMGLRAIEVVPRAYEVSDDDAYKFEYSADESSRIAIR